jgi:hypothetical protein
MLWHFSRAEKPCEDINSHFLMNKKGLTKFQHPVDACIGELQK